VDVPQGVIRSQLLLHCKANIARSLKNHFARVCHHPTDPSSSKTYSKFAVKPRPIQKLVGQKFVKSSKYHQIVLVTAIHNPYAILKCVINEETNRGTVTCTTAHKTHTITASWTQEPRH
jgi:hypothetical protein